MDTKVQDPNPPQNPDQVHDNVFRAVKDEVQHEVAHMQDSKVPVDPTQSDVLVQKHVTGISVILFAAIAVVLLLAIAGIYWYTHAHSGPAPGTTGTLLTFVQSSLG
jgi:hypothetical protein